jgi:uncharacterized BrkB/YihY/UPF0761 family membrane protein
MDTHPLVKFIIFALMVMIIGALVTAFVNLFLRKNQKSDAGIKALTVRVALSITLFVLLMIMYRLGIIHPHGG